MTAAPSHGTNTDKDSCDASHSGVTGKLYLKGIELREELSEKREELHRKYEEVEERLDTPVSSKPRWARLTKADLFKLIGLVTFLRCLLWCAFSSGPSYLNLLNQAE